MFLRFPQGVGITRESVMTGLFEANMRSGERGICFGSPDFLLAVLQWHVSRARANSHDR
jgi:hypothetical protein